MLTHSKYCIIETKYLPATTHKPARVKAYARSGIQKTIPWYHQLSSEQNHDAAFKALATEYRWYKPLSIWVSASKAKSSGRVYIRTN